MAKSANRTVTRSRASRNSLVDVTSTCNASEETRFRFETFSVLAPLGWMTDGVIMHAAGFSTEQVSVSSTGEQLGFASSIAKSSASVPFSTVTVRTFASNEHAGVPVPVDATVCGEPGALEVMVNNLPLIVPTTVGANFTLTTQL